VETQAKIVKEMRGRLHEMNNSLTAVMDAHQQRITVRIETAKKQHQVLSQRCLKLAVKVQVLRNRGYALDAAEEALRKTLMGLEKQVFDPGFVGREDEIWARMVALRERIRWLEEEGKRVQGRVEQTQGSTQGAVSEDVMARARKILKDYDEQLQHLNKELGEVRKEFIEWEASQRRR
jgi:nuclear pore complex protein Nup54